MNNKKVLVLISAIILMIMALGTAYAFFNYTKISTRSHQMLAGDISLVYNEEQDTLSLTNFFPETAEEARSRNDNFITFTIDGTNQSGKNINYEIDLLYGDEISGRNRIADNLIAFDLEENNTLIVDSGSYEDISNSVSIWNNTIPGGTSSNITKTYKLRMWVSDDILISDTNPDANYTTSEFKNLFASIRVRVLGDFAEHTHVSTRTIYKVMANNVSANNEVDFSNISPIDDNNLNGQGIQIYDKETYGVDSDGGDLPIYYYRGDVNNNNVEFAGICWRILRTTSTGGVKLIYNGTYSNSTKCSSSGVGNIDGGGSNYSTEWNAGYTYYKNSVDNNSTAKTVIEQWFLNNIVDKVNYNDYLEDVGFCNDVRTLSSAKVTELGLDSNYGWYNAAGRLTVTNNHIPTPTLGCPESYLYTTSTSERGNKKLTYPVSLITGDEVVLAGGKYNASNQRYFLYSNYRYGYWTLSPVYSQYSVPYMFVNRVDTSLYAINVSNNGGVGIRPVISLKPDVKILDDGSTGTYSNPYRVIVE